MPSSLTRRRVRRNFFSQFVGKDDLCFDIGAHKGDISQVLLELGAKVICVEPQKECVQFLETRFGESESLVLVKAAAADQEGENMISICDAYPEISSLSKQWTESQFHANKYDYQWNRKERVRTITLDQIIEEYGLASFCKIDVEGYEKEVLLGLSQALPCLSFELNTNFYENRRDGVERSLECAEILSRLGGYKWNFTHGGKTELYWSDWKTRKELGEKLFALSKEDEILWGDIYAKLD